MTGLEIRKKFIKFFEKHGHVTVPSSPLIPADDPTLLFANAGMNQFKDVFLGKEKRSYTRATSIQKCVRAGGKHNDLDEVGFSERHLTFFEMMGNFSFGDYFKTEAIEFAWNFLTVDMGLDSQKLYPTVFTDDDQAYNIWRDKIGVPENQITRLGEKDNFWQMGDVGPCGPCSEILYDRGAGYGCGKNTCKPGCDCARYTEVWNLVFMQYNKQDDGSLKPLGQTGVDTGMGFERLCMISQDVKTIYDTDIFQSIIHEIERLSGKNYKDMPTPFKVLTDHVRSTCLIMADGGTPSNDGRGYVLRKIIRRAAMFANKLSSKVDFFPSVAKAFIKSFSPIYPELLENEELILKLLSSEIERFINNLNSGEVILEKYLSDLKANKKTVLSGEDAFKLYDTYGFPLELTTAIARENNLTVDTEGYEKNMKEQKALSGKKVSKDNLPKIPDISSEFLEELDINGKVLFVKGADDGTWIVCDKTPFYVESGGQVSDTCHIEINEKNYAVLDLKKSGGAILAKIEPGAKIKVGDIVRQVVDEQKRMDAVRNHTATHLLQAALIRVLGRGVKQSGSLVEPDYLRFDFTHHETMSLDQIAKVEKLINDVVQKNIKTKVYHTTLAKAKEAGVIAFFGEKYDPQNVRVVEVPGFSIELCGGTHAERTGIIGLFKIVSEVALSTGVRRIIAITGPKALELSQSSFNTVKKLGEEFKVKPEQVLDAVHKQQNNYSDSLKEIKRLKKELVRGFIPKWQDQVSDVNNIPFLYLELESLGNDEMKSICQEIEKKSPGLYFIVSKQDSRINFIGYLSKTLSDKVNMKELSKYLKEHGLRGGGSPTTIQGGGEYISGIDKLITDWIKS